MSNEKKRLDWLDYLKGWAILAVLFDHLPMLFPELHFHPVFRAAAQFNVPLFIFAGGIGAYLSLSRHFDFSWRGIWRRVHYVLLMYVIASLPYAFFKAGGLNAAFLWDKLIHFNASIAFYYIFIYCQLTAVAPVLYVLLDASRKSWWKRMLLLLAVLAVSVASIRWTMWSPEITGWGKYFLGGPYFFVFLLGMVVMEYLRFRPTEVSASTLMRTILRMGLPGVVMIAVAWGLLQTGGRVTDFCERTMMARILYTLGVTGVLVVLFRLQPHHGALNYLGRHSLFIYLYHMAVIHFFKHLLEVAGGGVTLAIWCAIFVASIILPVLLEWMFRMAGDFFKAKIQDCAQA